MQQTLGKLRNKKLSAMHKVRKRSGLIDYQHELDSNGSRPGPRARPADRSPSAASPDSGDRANDNYDELNYSAGQNSARTVDLFRYARRRELAAIVSGVAFMVYAASWQPISVFILAIMASLMGQYSKQTRWLKTLNYTSNGAQSNAQSGLAALLMGGGLSSEAATGPVNTSATTEAPPAYEQADLVRAQNLINDYNRGNQSQHLMAAGGSPGGLATTASSMQQHSEGLFVQAAASYDHFSFLDSLYSLVTPLFELSASSAHQQQAAADNIRAALQGILENESRQFLRKSFEINGAAFLLALTQLLAFFLGMSLITWAARKQASRIKLLYFDSCLHQEVTWFEAIDSASGSGSSLNGLVDKYEDGIGMKLALLCYFLGHVGLFALTAFQQMFTLAAFCMPFVLLIGLVIAYLSEWQAQSIGQHALFAKRSLQVAEEIVAAIRTVFAFNGQQKEIARYSLSLEPVYRKSLIKHLYTALNTSLSKFSIFACFSVYCFYAERLFPPHSEHANLANKATILAVMRGAEVSIVNILISIPFLEALQQSKGSIARILVAIGRRSRIDAASERGLRLDQPRPGQQGGHNNNNNNDGGPHWRPSISFRMVQFGYANRAGPTTRRRSTLPFLTLDEPCAIAGGGGGGGDQRRRSVIEQIADEAMDSTKANGARAGADAAENQNNNHKANTGLGHHSSSSSSSSLAAGRYPRRQSAVIRHMLGNEIRHSQLDSRVLNCFNLEIAPGQSVALVGPSGSGKSTVLALVQRLYDISGGQLLIGQHDIKDLNLAWLRNQIGLVGQEPRLFDMTIAENILLGLARDEFDGLAASDELLSRSGLGDAAEGESAPAPGLHDDEGKQCDKNAAVRQRARLMQQVIEASKSANAHEFIVRLPEGYATRVGSGGVQLSGGQKQRIAIARALIRKPKILLLDECTSALDTESEAQVHAALKALADSPARQRTTTLIVAHRLDTIKHVDLIVVMNQGQVVACGRHEELLTRAAEQSQGQHDSSASKAARDAYAGARIYQQLWQEQLQARQQAAGRAPASVAAGSILEQDEQGEAGAQPQRRDRDDKTPAGDEGALKGALVAARADRPGGPQAQAVDLGSDRGEKSLQRLAGFRCAPASQTNSDNSRRRRESIGHNGEMIVSSQEEEEDDGDDDCDGHHDEHSQSGTCSTSCGSSLSQRPSAWRLWQFVEMPKWSTFAAVFVCLLAGLILPLNLIAHSYLFSVFAYNELDQIGAYLHVFGLLILSFSTFVFIISFLQVLLPGYVGERLSVRLRVKTIDSLLQKPMFYFDMDSNSAGALCDRFNGYISNLQNIAGARIATVLEATSTLAAGAVFGFGQNLALSLFCLSFALLVLITTIVESKIVELETRQQQKYDAQLAHLMSDSLSNIKTIASLNRERFFVHKFGAILGQRERSIGRPTVYLHTFLTSLKFVMPAMSWSASMYYGSYLLASDRIDLQTIYIVCPVVLFAVNDTFRALVFLPELLKARSSIKRLFKLNREFSPEVLQTLTLAQQLTEQNRLHLEQLVAESGHSAASGGGGESSRRRSNLAAALTGSPPADFGQRKSSLAAAENQLDVASPPNKPKKSISFALELPQSDENARDGPADQQRQPQQAHQQLNRRLSNIQSLPSYMSRKSSRLNSLVPRSMARGRIEFRDVEFAYPNRPAALVLDGLSLSVEPGESVALVGTSGSGKSTTVAVLEKFYDYHAGSVTLDGRDLRLVEPSWVRSQIGLVQQEPCLLSCSIGDNIRYGDNSRFVSMAEVVEAARTANIHDFIMTLPDQYDTELASSAYSSCQLSGGQRQRIAIARALVRNAPILIFDEATSALDNKNEQMVQDALRKAKRGRTNLTIAHRLSTIKDADKIVVLRDGKVVEQGKHEELIRRPGGAYKLLWERQGGPTAVGAAEAAAEAAQSAGEQSARSVDATS